MKSLLLALLLTVLLAALAGCGDGAIVPAEAGHRNIIKYVDMETGTVCYRLLGNSEISCVAAR